MPIGGNRKRITHVGFKSERTIFPGGELEAAFAYEWIKQNECYGGNFLQIMLNGDRIDGLITPTQRDARVAATVIQWLGSNLGYAFLNRALARTGEYVGNRRADKRHKST